MPNQLGTVGDILFWRQLQRTQNLEGLERGIKIGIDIDGSARKPFNGRSGERYHFLIEVDCGEMTVDEQIALASAISDGLGGKGMALVKDTKIVLDVISGEVSTRDVLALVRNYVARRKDAQNFSVDTKGDEIIVHTPDPLARSRGRRDTGQLLPPNLLQCPFCSFVTPYQELYNIHVRSHGFGF